MEDPSWQITEDLEAARAEITDLQSQLEHAEEITRERQGQRDIAQARISSLVWAKSLDETTRDARLIEFKEVLREYVDAMALYEADADSGQPYEHRAMRDRARKLLGGT